MRIATLAALAALVMVVPVTADVMASGRQDADSEMLNEPSANWNVYGTGETHKARRDKSVQGGGAMRVTIAKKPANPWDVGASSEISKPIHKGDTLVFAFWGRLVSGGADGKTEVAAMIQRNSAPYDAIVSGKVTLTDQWQLVHVQGIAGDDFPAGTANVALSIGTAAHVIDLGPAFVMRLQ